MLQGSSRSTRFRPRQTPFNVYEAAQERGQEMKRTALLGCLLVAVLACTAALSTPKAAHALLCCDNGEYQTSQWWVWAPTCSEAQSNFQSFTLPEAQAACGGVAKVCAITLPPCLEWNGGWKVSGCMIYGCRTFCGPPTP